MNASAARSSREEVSTFVYEFYVFSLAAGIDDCRTARRMTTADAQCMAAAISRMAVMVRKYSNA